MSSLFSGLFVGLVIAVALATVYGDDVGRELRELVDRLPVSAASEQAPPEAIAQVVPEEAARQAPVPMVTSQTTPPAEATAGVNDDVLHQRWAEFASQAARLEPVGEFRFRDCFTRAAAAYRVSEPLLLAVASGESNFDPAARSDRDAIGLMQIRWPGTSRHLGILRQADLYNPCTNVDAGARYLAELSERFDHDLHRTVAAYNYGPGRIEAGAMPEGARWYSQYIYQHLQRVLGRAQTPTSELIPPDGDDGGGFQVLFRFHQSYRARDFIAFMGAQVPGLNLAQRSEALGQHEVVLLYETEDERRRALQSIRDAGLLALLPDTEFASKL